MPQPDAPKFSGTWKALFICPNQKIIRDLAPLLRKHLPTFSGPRSELLPDAPPTGRGAQLRRRPICVCSRSENHPTPGWLSFPTCCAWMPSCRSSWCSPSNDPELVLRCLRQGASDFLIPPFTSEQVEGALQKIARLQPSRAAGNARQSLLHYARQRRLRRQHHRQQSGLSDEARRQAHSAGGSGSAGRNALVPAEDQIQLQLHGRAGALARYRCRPVESRGHQPERRGRAAFAGGDDGGNERAQGCQQHH